MPIGHTQKELPRPRSAQEMVSNERSKVLLRPTLTKNLSGEQDQLPTSGVQKLIKEQREKSARKLSPEREAELAKQEDLIKKLQNYKECLGITQPGYATGDQFSIAATLVSNPNTVIFIEKVDSKITDMDKSKQDKVAEIVEFYESCGIDPKRIAIVESRQQLKTDLDKKDPDKKDPDKKDPDKKDLDKPSKRLMSESQVTQYVAENYDKEMLEKTRKAFRVDQHHDEVETWLASKNITIPRKTPVVILWSRFSGKGGAAHPEHDTSYEGMRQLIEGIPSDCTIVIAGDRHPVRGGEANDKYDQMAVKAANGEFGEPKKVINLTNIWKEQGVESWANDRVEQLRIYDYLNKQAAGNLTHLGPRSGNLEAMALIGHDVRYMEEYNALGASRMASWAGNEVIRYNRNLIDAPQTRDGKHIKASIDEDRKPKLQAAMEKLLPPLDKKLETARGQLEKAKKGLGELTPSQREEYEKLSKWKEECERDPKQHETFQTYQSLEESISKEQSIAAEIEANGENWPKKRLDGMQRQKAGCRQKIEKAIKTLNGDPPGKGITEQSYNLGPEFENYQQYKSVDSYQKVKALESEVKKHEELKIKLEATIEKLKKPEVTLKEMTDLGDITDEQVEKIMVDPQLLSPSFLRAPKEARIEQKKSAGIDKLAKGFTQKDLDEIRKLQEDSSAMERVKQYFRQSLEA